MNLGIRFSFKFYQDNDPKNKAWKNRMWLLFKGLKVVETPLQSPDLNQIENCWHELKRRVHKTTKKSKHELKKKLMEEWAPIDAHYTQKIVASMPKKFMEVLSQKGHQTKY